jgi:hypothetical protein
MLFKAARLGSNADGISNFKKAFFSISGLQADLKFYFQREKTLPTFTQTVGCGLMSKMLQVMNLPMLMKRWSCS